MIVANRDRQCKIDPVVIAGVCEESSAMVTNRGTHTLMMAMGPGSMRPIDENGLRWDRLIRERTSDPQKLGCFPNAHKFSIHTIMIQRWIV